MHTMITRPSGMRTPHMSWGREGRGGEGEGRGRGGEGEGSEGMGREWGWKETL